MPETLQWVDADGTVHDLTAANGAKPLKGVEGRFMPPVSFVEEEVPLQPGARLRQTKTLPREVGVPVVFTSATETDLRTALRNWLHRLNIDRGDGKLRVTAPGGDVRELPCRYAGGMELVEDADTKMATWQKAVVVFRAVDPYWYDQAETVSTYTTGEAAAFFPFFPLRLSSSEVFADATVDNTGDVDAWPTWEIKGPGTNPVLRNLTTGKLISITKTLAAGETIEIDTRPGFKTVELQDGTNLYSSLSSTSSLWPLLRGSNSVRIELSAATANSEVVLRYKRRYLGA